MKMPGDRGRLSRRSASDPVWTSATPTPATLASTNPLFYKPVTRMLFGDARDAVEQVVPTLRTRW